MAGVGILCLAGTVLIVVRADKPILFLGAAVLEAQTERMDRDLWGVELEAQRYETRIIGLWDELRASPEPLSVLESFPFREITLPGPKPSATETWDHGIVRRTYSSPGPTLVPSEWRAVLEELRAWGLQIKHTEWHHERFDPEPGGAKSLVKFRIQAVLPDRGTKPAERVDMRGEFAVAWDPKSADQPSPAADVLEVKNIEAVHYPGKVAFTRELSFDAPYDRANGYVGIASPFLLHDLNGDGLTDIIQPSLNVVRQNRGAWKFETERLFTRPPGLVPSALIADLDVDGKPDLVLGALSGPPRVHFGIEGGFAEKPRRLPVQRDTWRGPMAIGAGDIDGDGDLDLFLGQYKLPYIYGQMPTPYFDANDGYPAYLFRNDGDTFTDITDVAGLSTKRYRRTFTTSFFDADGDGDQDLLVVSDFAGADLYLNDGSGRFRDVSDRLSPRHTFGMSHQIFDANLDGFLDLFITGMSSTTARRLDAAGLGNPQFPDNQKYRLEMSFGNRLYLGNGTGQFQLAPFTSQVARTGWSWGTETLDFDLDGDDDLFVATGNISGETVRDYCTQFWRRDIYLGNGKENPVLDRYFTTKLREHLEKNRGSYNPFEPNHLLMNQEGRRFIDVGFLMGVGDDFDGRSVASADFDMDGRPDLAVDQFRREDHGTLHLYRNVWDAPRRFIGVGVVAGKGASPESARVRVIEGETTQTWVFHASGLYLAQAPPLRAFGLRQKSGAPDIEVRWTDGTTIRLPNAAPDRYHFITKP